MRIHLIAFAIFVIALQNRSAFAQQEPSEQPQIPKWDVSASIGILGSTRRYYESGGRNYNDPLAFAWNVEAGRHLTTHLKANASVMSTNSRRVYGYAAYGTTSGVAYSWTKVRPVSVVAAATYQFLENAFVHPYLSAGVELTMQSERREEYSFISTNRINPVPVVSTQRAFHVLPVAAGGFKSYFNERAFMKSELLFAASAHGFSHTIVRVGFGYDF